MDYTEEEYEEEKRKLWIESLEDEIDLTGIPPGFEEGRPDWKRSRAPQDVKDLAVKVFPDNRWLAEPVLPTEGIALIAAESGSNKTWMALDLAICVALGRNWLKFKIEKPGKVLYLNCEVPEREIQRRILRFGVTGDFPEGHLHFVHDSWPLDSEEDFLELLDLLADEKYDLIIADTLSKVHTGKSEENSNDAMTDLMIRARQLGNISEGLFLFNHHVSKPPGFPLSLLHRIRGASAIRDNAGSAILLQKQGRGKDAYITVSNPKNWYGEEVEPFKAWLVDEDDLTYFKWEEVDGEDVDDVLLEEILERLNNFFDLGQEVSMTDLRNAVSTSAQKVVTSVVEDLERGERVILSRSWRRKTIKPGPRWDW